MPKNSRRKKQTRQHAVRKGERYTRAGRDLAATAQVPPIQQLPTLGDMWSRATLGDDYVTLFEDLHQVQRVVESRGWVVASFCDYCVDANGMAQNTQILWEFAAAFGGAELDGEEDEEPQKPTCGVNGGMIWIETAGNWGGCEEHATAKMSAPWTDAGIAELPDLLNRVEEASRKLDPAPFIECLTSGPCAERARQRDEQMPPAPWES